MKIENCKVGHQVYYQGELWEIGFINRRHFAGTVRLQKNGGCDARQVNYISPADLTDVEDEELTWLEYEDDGPYAQ